MEDRTLAITRTLAQLRGSVKRAAGMNTSGTSVSLTPEVLDEIINDAVGEGWDVIVSKWLDYYISTQSISLIAGTDEYSLATDFYKLRVVWIQDGTRWIKLSPASLDAAHEFTGNSVGTKGEYRYRLTNRKLVLMPVPSSAETLRVYYIPIKTEMSSDSDSVTFDVPIELKYIIAIAWRDVLDQQNLDPSPAIAKIQQYEQKLRTAADSLDASEPFYLNPRGPSSSDDDWGDL
jgi:hypothetical protein